ncbi:MAG: hypothetical protein UHN47_18360, partial [Lachnospiraceae bacterium]|nr:hypothetical protein [Lachnospiraceae bacterium]
DIISSPQTTLHKGKGAELMIYQNAQNENTKDDFSKAIKELRIAKLLLSTKKRKPQATKRFVYMIRFEKPLMRLSPMLKRLRRLTSLLTRFSTLQSRPTCYP